MRRYKTKMENLSPADKKAIKKLCNYDEVKAFNEYRVKLVNEYNITYEQYKHFYYLKEEVNTLIISFLACEENYDKENNEWGSIDYFIDMFDAITID